MKYFILILSFIFYHNKSSAQSTPWYYGGKADGHAGTAITNFSPSVLPSHVVYKGSKGDGANMLSLNNFTPTKLKQQIPYAGNKGDGGSKVAINNFIPSLINHQIIYAGNKGDGGSKIAINNFSPNIVMQYVAYFGGKGDGWSNQLAIAWPLPVILLSFEGIAQENKNLLKWSTSFEENVSFFSLEKSKNAQDFNSIAHVDAKGNSSIEEKYHYTDYDDVFGVNYYRLNIVDHDKQFTYSKVVRLVNDFMDYEIVLSPNPAKNTIRLSFSMALSAQSNFKIYDVNGKVIINATIQKDESVKNIDISSLSAGNYFIHVQTPHENISMPFIKQ